MKNKTPTVADIIEILAFVKKQDEVAQWMRSYGLPYLRVARDETDKLIAFYEYELDPLYQNKDYEK